MEQQTKTFSKGKKGSADRKAFIAMHFVTAPVGDSNLWVCDGEAHGYDGHRIHRAEVALFLPDGLYKVMRTKTKITVIKGADVENKPANRRLGSNRVAMVAIRDNMEVAQCADIQRIINSAKDSNNMKFNVLDPSDKDEDSDPALMTSRACYEINRVGVLANIRYVEDIVGHGDDWTVFCMPDKRTGEADNSYPILFRHVDRLAVVMPIKK